MNKAADVRIAKGVIGIGGRETGEAERTENTSGETDVIAAEREGFEPSDPQTDIRKLRTFIITNKNGTS